MIVDPCLVEIKKQLDVADDYLYRIEVGEVEEPEESVLYIGKLLSKVSNDITVLTPTCITDLYIRRGLYHAISRLVMLMARKEQLSKSLHQYKKEPTYVVNHH